MSQTGWATPFPDMTTFGTAWDTYVPDGHPYDNPSLVFGLPPDLGTYAGTYGATSAGWFDGRNGSNGVMARYADGTDGITSNGAVGGYGAVWQAAGGYGYGLGDGPFGRPSKQANNVTDAGRFLGGGDNLGGLAKWSFQMTLYTNPNGAVVSGASGSYSNSHNRTDGYNPDFWWTNGIGDSTTGYYATETGMAVWHDTPTTWRFTTTGGGAIATGVASGQWVTLEVRYDFSGTQLSAVHNLWAINSSGQPTALLGSYTIPAGSMFQNPTSAGTQGGPRYSWMTVYSGQWNSYDHMVIGNTGVGVPLALSSHGHIGDMDDSGSVDNFDISPFELALTNPTAYLAAYPTMTNAERIYRGDVNGDTFFDNFDISPFEFLVVNGHYPGAAVPEPSTLALLALGGVGLLLSRVRKSLSAKWLKVAAVLLVVSLAISVGTAQASTIFLSTTSTNPVLTNPSLTILTNSSATLYAFWAPSTEQTGTDGYGYPIISPEQLSGWSHDIVDDNAILSRTTYTFVNPTAGGSPRWGATNTGTSSGTFLTQAANAVKVGGSNLGFFTSAGQGYFNVGGQDVWRLAALTVSSGGTTGTSNIKLDVGPSGISFQNAPTARTIHFGFGDAGVSSNSFGSVTTIKDASITVVPEPGTLALLGMGAVGLVAIARRRRRAA